MSVTREFTVDSDGPLNGETYALEFSNVEWKRVDRAMNATGMAFEEFVREADRFVSNNHPEWTDLEREFREVGGPIPKDEFGPVEAEYAPKLYKERAVMAAESVVPDPIRGLGR